jgi:hypothetical protein
MWFWEKACAIARDLVAETPITGYHSKVENCKWYHSCRTDIGWVPVDPDYVHADPDLQAYPHGYANIGTLFFYEHAFATEGYMNCQKEAP